MLSEPGSHPYSKLNLSTFEGNLGLPRHRWLEFKEGFSADLVRLAVADFGLRRKPAILDPFVGSGTSIVEAGFLGLGGTGIELNPFLHFAAGAKIQPQFCDRKTLLDGLEAVLDVSPKGVRSPLEGHSTFTKHAKVDKWLFNLGVLRGFTALRQSIHRKKVLRQPLEIALLGALLDCSNAKRDGKCLRYKREWREDELSFSDLKAAFRKRSLNVIDDIGADTFSSKRLSIVKGDCRVMLKTLESESHDLLITSPPYMNSFDYSDVYRPELFASGFVASNADLRKIRLATIRSHVQVQRAYSEEVVSSLLKPVLARVSAGHLWNKNIPGMIRSYFADMASVLKESYRVIRKGGTAWIVVSTSAYAGQEVPVDLALADVAVQNGWKLTGVYVLRQLRAAGQHWAHIEKGAKPPLRESLIVLRK